MSPRFEKMGSAAEDLSKRPSSADRLVDGKADDYNKAEIVDLAEYKESKEGQGEDAKETSGGTAEKPDVDSLKAETEEAGLELAETEVRQEESFQKIKEVLPDADLPQADPGLRDNFKNKRDQYTEAVLESGGTPAEALEANIQAGVDVVDAKTESRAQKIGGALMKGIGKVGQWMSTPPGEKIVKGAGFVATAVGGPVVWAKRLAREVFIRSDKIAEKFGASEKTVEKISKFTKEASAVGVGKRVAGMAENAQARYKEKKSNKFEAMSQEEKLAHLDKFDGSTFQKLEKALTSKTAAKVAGLIAGAAIVLAAGSAMGSILEGNIDIPTGSGIHERIANVPDDAHEHAAKAAEKVSNQSGSGSFKFGEGHKVEGNIMEKARREDAENLIRQAKAMQESAGMQGATGDVQENYSNVNHEDVVNNASKIETPKSNNDVIAALNNMKKPDLTTSHPTHTGGFENAVSSTHEATQPEQAVSVEPKVQHQENQTIKTEEQSGAYKKEMPAARVAKVSLEQFVPNLPNGGMLPLAQMESLNPVGFKALKETIARELGAVKMEQLNNLPSAKLYFEELNKAIADKGIDPGKFDLRKMFKL